MGKETQPKEKIHPEKLSLDERRKAAKRKKSESFTRRLINGILRSGERKILNECKNEADNVVEKLDDLYHKFEHSTPEEIQEALQKKTADFKEQIQKSKNKKDALDKLLPEAFAVVAFAADQVLNMPPFYTQITGAVALHRGNIAEMQTGEGKTLTSTMPVYLNALTGEGVHVVTVNDYLANRDAKWMGQIYNYLGLSVGVLLPNRPTAEHKTAYQCDITYGTSNEFGFDYLRDNMAISKEQLVQRGHPFAIVDEVDSILIDEARNPLIISGPAEGSPAIYQRFAEIMKQMTGTKGEVPFDASDPNSNIHYEVDEAKRTVTITRAGEAYIEKAFGITNLYEPINTPLISYMKAALKAKELYKRDKNYIVSNGEVLIVDELTGRIQYGRRYSDGIHQSIEAKEKVPIKQENQTIATTTLQNYFRLYDKLSGMTGTAMTEADEFNKVYKIGVVQIDTHEPNIRHDHSDVIYKNERAKTIAIIEDIMERHNQGQPVLVGTQDVERSEELSRILKDLNIPHNVLNAKYHATEAKIIAEAGRLGAVTIATNMAGRGTDIKLGGDPELLAMDKARQETDTILAKRLKKLEAQGITLTAAETKELDDTIYRYEYRSQKRRFDLITAYEKSRVIDEGGLYVLGDERNDSRRIDKQLQGRSGRQGDPGESRFYLSLEDDLLKRFRGSAVAAVMDRLKIPEDVPIENKLVTRQIESAQAQITAQHEEVRKDLLKYDEVLNKQRKEIYRFRRDILEGKDMHERVLEMIDGVIGAYVDGATASVDPETWDLQKLWESLKIQLREPTVTIGKIEQDSGGKNSLNKDVIKEDLITDFREAYEKMTKELTEPIIKELERNILLVIIDQKWKEHLYEMDYLRDGVGLRAYAQRDPLVEYNREGWDMFGQMRDGIEEGTITNLFRLIPKLTPQQLQAFQDQLNQREQQQKTTSTN